MEIIKFLTIFFTTIGLLILNNGQIIEGKIFTRCQLVNELSKYHFDRSLLSNWVCLIENESGRDTNKLTRNTNLSSSYGLFQINSKTWCREGRRGGDCNMKCEDFLSDNIEADTKCAKMIFNHGGFQSWNGWVTKCRGKPLPNISTC